MIETRSASFAEAVGAINRPLQVCRPRSWYPEYFVKIHYQALAVSAGTTP